MTQAFHNSISTVISKFDDMSNILFQHIDNINTRLASFTFKLEEIEGFVKTKKDDKGTVHKMKRELTRIKMATPMRKRRMKEIEKILKMKRRSTKIEEIISIRKQKVKKMEKILRKWEVKMKQVMRLLVKMKKSRPPKNTKRMR